MMKEKKNHPVFAMLLVMVTINIIFEIIHGFNYLFIGDALSIELFQSTGWVLKLLPIIIFIMLVGYLFGGSKKK